MADHALQIRIRDVIVIILLVVIVRLLFFWFVSLASPRMIVCNGNLTKVY
jgi:hypothetical protein